MKKIISIFICLLCFGCSSSHDHPQKILVTIPPYADIVKKLVGNQVGVEIFVPPGSNPHTYEPTPDQIKHFTQARVWFRIGDPVENKMAQLLKKRKVKIVDLSANRQLIGGHSHTHDTGEVHEEKDLHLWMNPLIVIEQVKEMSNVLSKQFPELAAKIKDNSLQLQTELKQLDSNITTELAPFKGQYLLVSHPALGYYCQRYDLHQLSIEVEGKDPLPQDIARLISELNDHPIPVVLIEPQYNKKGALLIAEKLHIPHEEINPYDEDYFGMLNHLTKIIVKYYDHTNS